MYVYTWEGHVGMERQVNAMPMQLTCTCRPTHAWQQHDQPPGHVPAAYIANTCTYIGAAILVFSLCHLYI